MSLINVLCPTRPPRQGIFQPQTLAVLRRRQCDKTVWLSRILRSGHLGRPGLALSPMARVWTSFCGSLGAVRTYG